MKINKNYKIIVILLVFLITIILGLTLRLQRPSYPNIILITVDALRADHLGCYGYKRNTSPNIDKLAKEGTIFLNCFATGSGTVYSFPGILTGRYLEIGKDYIFFDNILDQKFTTLAEYLKNAGYYTAAFIDNEELKIGKGFEQGFNSYYNHWPRESNAEKITTNVLNLLNNYRSNRPFFIWIHYHDAHIPYFPQEEYFKGFEDDSLYKENDKILEFNPKANSSPFVSHGYIPPVLFHKDKYNLNYYVAYYDAEIRSIDFHLRKILNNMKDNTVIILSADHGEFLGEHNYYFVHGENIYDEVLHIPLIIKDNRDFKGGKRISTVASSVDIVPTILNRIDPARYFFNKNKFDGIDLKEIVKGKDTKRKYIYSYFPWARIIRDVNKNIKYFIRDNRKEELYFLPDEYTNHINDKSLEVTYIKEELRESLRKWLKGYPIRADKNSKKMFLDEDAKRLLRGIGYLQ